MLAHLPPAMAPSALAVSFKHMTLQVLLCTQPLPLSTSTSKLVQAVLKVNCDLNP